MSVTRLHVSYMHYVYIRATWSNKACAVSYSSDVMLHLVSATIYNFGRLDPTSKVFNLVKGSSYRSRVQQSDILMRLILLPARPLTQKPAVLRTS
jgi:hypothetical protein